MQANAPAPADQPEVEVNAPAEEALLGGFPASISSYEKLLYGSIGPRNAMLFYVLLDVSGCVFAVLPDVQASFLALSPFPNIDRPPGIIFLQGG